MNQHMVNAYIDDVRRMEQKLRELNELTSEERDASPVVALYHDIVCHAFEQVDLVDSDEAWGGAVATCEVVLHFLNAAMGVGTVTLVSPDEELTAPMLAGGLLTVLALIVGEADRTRST